jgi:tripartite-type tricarboxylate transporter receptor subunit TctC
LRALAVTSGERSALLPDVPPIADSGLPGFAAVIRYGLAAPPGTPRRSSTGSTRSFAPRSRPTICAPSSPPTAPVPEPGSPEDYAAAIDADEKKWAPIVKSLNLKFE